MVSQITENDVVTDIIFISASRLETDSEAYPEMAGKQISRIAASDRIASVILRSALGLTVRKK